MRSRIDSALLAGAGALVVHALADLVGSFEVVWVRSGISHGNEPSLVMMAGLLGSMAIAIAVVRSLSVRVPQGAMSPARIGAGIGALHIGREAVERIQAGESAGGLASEPLLWISIVLVPIVAIALTRWSGAAAAAIVRAVGTRARRRACIASVITVDHAAHWRAELGGPILNHALTRRGPPLLLLRANR